MRITVLGNGDSLGTPRVYCECAVCEEARSGGRNARLRPSVWLECDGEAPMLLDCGPDWRTQMEKLGVRRVGRGLLTHAHFDHIGGLVEWADACRWLDTTAAVYAPREVIGEVLSRFPWIGARLRLTENDGGIAYGGWSVKPWRVNHGKNGYAYAYRFDHPTSGSSWAYCSDSFDLSEAEKRPLRGVDLLVLGTSYYKEPYARETRSLYDVTEGLELVREVGAKMAVFTHLSHDIDVRKDYGLPPNVRLAQEGLVLTIG
ncbi:MBL fold metallo-hydrolase [Cohnella fermenti]|uniref:MBL fold metallo-hydrolase n=1 Tax=Cohnella fermenti TaxID=2565925 RepID=A0A4V3WE28_9BACL|nr:MBL fold metallo-hydrolase [Cohnella fermenti]THF74574.1 MBL fold metallo-hydrolase [Cohnella fermenti]